MTDQDKLDALKTILFGSATDTSVDDELTVYLTMAGNEIVAFKYSMRSVPDDAVVPAEDETTQIQAAAIGYSHKGGQGEVAHDENGINRSWKHPDMVAYIRNHVKCYAGLR